MTKINRPIQVVGMSIITSNEEAFKQNSIAKLWGEFLQSSIKQKLQAMMMSEKIYAVYSDYENGDRGKYRITIGYAVEKTNDIPVELISVVIPVGDYKIYQIKNQVEEIISTWKKIWESDSSILQRNFVVDFEEYDEEKVNIYIGCH